MILYRVLRTVESRILRYYMEEHARSPWQDAVFSQLNPARFFRRSDLLLLLQNWSRPLILLLVLLLLLGWDTFARFLVCLSLIHLPKQSMSTV